MLDDVEQSFQVRRFPTIVIYQRSSEVYRYEYTKYLRSIQIVDRMLTMLRADVQLIHNRSEIQPFLRSHAAVMIGCFVNDSNNALDNVHTYTAFEKAGKGI